MNWIRHLVLAIALFCSTVAFAADPSKTNGAAGTSALATTVASFGFTATAGRLLVITVASDDYNVGNPTEYTLSNEMEQETFLGSYLWWKIATGTETAATYIIGSATGSAWTVTEFDNVDATPYDGSEGQLTATEAATYTTPNLTPTTGRRLLLAAFGGSRDPATFTGLGTWTNSFTEVNESFHALSATGGITGLAMRVVDGDSSTAFSSGVTYSPAPDARTAHIIAFEVAAAAGPDVTPFYKRKGGQ